MPKLTMRMTIFKYSLEVGVNEIVMPVGSKLLSVGSQHGRVTLWALVDNDAASETRIISVVGVGWNIESQSLVLPFVGTVQVSSLVWHVFDGTLK